MDIASVRRQLAALFLTLLSVVAFSGSALADCLSDLLAADGDCHEVQVDECEHHAAGGCLGLSASCDEPRAEVVTPERKLLSPGASSETGAEPAAGPPVNGGPPAPGWRSPPTLPTTSFLPDTRGLHLLLVRFLE